MSLTLVKVSIVPNTSSCKVLLQILIFRSGAVILKLAEQTPLYAYRKFFNQYNTHVHKKVIAA